MQTPQPLQRSMSTTIFPFILAMAYVLEFVLNTNVQMYSECCSAQGLV